MGRENDRRGAGTDRAVTARGGHRGGQRGVYVGKAKELTKRLAAYPRNVRDILLGRGWHGQDERKFRKVHYSLHQAHQDGLVVSLAVLENCPAEVLDDRERYWINRRREEAAQGGPALLNGR